MPKKKANTQSKAAAKAAKKVKVEKKLEKKETKKNDKHKEEDDDDDLEGILDKMKREWEEAHKVTEETVGGPPSRRANATLTACPNGNHLWCIGGEYFSDDGKAYFYNDVYRYSPEKDEWRRFTSPTCPGPRSAHAAVAVPSGGGKLFLFGGEFSSLYQNTFHHYRDFWVFDIPTHSWERIDTKIKPSARSGHRMAVWKNFVVLFGGFYDPGIRTIYLNDLWLFDLQDYKWRQVEFREGVDRRPSPRSGFSFLPHKDGIILQGGYCKEYVKGKHAKGVALEDNWFLKMSSEIKEIKWEKRKKLGYAPSLRSGCTMAYWANKEMGVLFGGVNDDDEGEERMKSEFYNDMFALALANSRWTSLQIKKKKSPGQGKKKLPAKDKAPSKPQPQNDTPWKDDDGDEDDYGLEDDDIAEAGTERMSPASPVPAPIKNLAPTDDSDEPVKPLPRYNAMLTVLRNTLFIYGGILERGSREYTMDDFWSVQLDKMDAFNCLKSLSVDVTGPEESSSDDDSDEDGSDSDSEDEGSLDGNAAEEVEELPKEPAPVQTEEDLRAQAAKFLDMSRREAPSAAEALSTPLPGETLAMFYARSREYWAQTAHNSSDNRGKSLRRDGFGLAEARYLEYKPILEEVEKILAEAGLDDAEMKRAGGGIVDAGGGPSRNRR